MPYDKEEVSIIARVVKAINLKGESADAMSVLLGLDSKEELSLLRRFLFVHASSDKEAYLYMLSVSEKDFIDLMESRGWYEISWRDEFIDNSKSFWRQPAGFYGRHPDIGGGDIVRITMKSALINFKNTQNNTSKV